MKNVKPLIAAGALAVTALGFTASPAMAFVYGTQVACGNCAARESDYTNPTCHALTGALYADFLFYQGGDAPECHAQSTEVSYLTSVCASYGYHCLNKAYFSGSYKICSKVEHFIGNRDNGAYWQGAYNNGGMAFICGN